MLRQVSSRNHRAKGGFRAKNAFQVTVLVAVCVWLLYQMKYSHDHRKAYEEKFAVDGSQSEIARFGRNELLRDSDPAEDASAREDDVEHKRRIAARVERDGKTKPGAAEEQVHEEHSREAREKSFRGDDASSEVVHHIQEVEHEEQTQEARERSFKADDVSSAVDHGAPLKEEQTQEVEHALNATSDEKKKKKKKSPSSNATDESDNSLEGGTGEIVANIANEADPRRFRANELGNLRELGLRSRNLSKDHPANKTAVAEPKLLNQTALHTLQDLNDTAKSSEGNELNGVEVLHKKSGQIARSQPSEEKSKALPLNLTAEGTRDEHGHPLQNKVESQKEDCVVGCEFLLSPSKQ